MSEPNELIKNGALFDHMGTSHITILVVMDSHKHMHTNLGGGGLTQTHTSISFKSHFLII